MSKKDPFDIPAGVRVGTINLTPRFDQPPVRALFVEGGSNQMHKAILTIRKLNSRSGKKDAEVRNMLEEIYDTAHNLIRMWHYDPSRGDRPESAD